MFSKIIGYFNHKDLKSDRWIFSIILVTAILCLVAAFVLSVDAIELVKNPNVKLNCSVNVIINCATVAKSQFATLFGFPNSFIGMMVEPIFIVVAIAILLGTKLPKKFMLAIQLLVIGSLVFTYALFFISTFIIQALCPWCFLVMISTTIMFFAITRYNVRENNLYFHKECNSIAKPFIEKDYDKLLLAIILAAVVALIIIKYGSGLFA